jgi:hypothetical protein
MSRLKSVVLAAAAATGLMLAAEPASAQYYGHPGYGHGYGYGRPQYVDPRVARKQQELQARRYRKQAEVNSRIQSKYGINPYANPYGRGYGGGYGGGGYYQPQPQYHYPQRRTQQYFYSWD